MLGNGKKTSYLHSCLKVLRQQRVLWFFPATEVARATTLLHVQPVECCTCNPLGLHVQQILVVVVARAARWGCTCKAFLVVVVARAGLLVQWGCTCSLLRELI